MSERADGELVLITGATRELGREVCHLFAGYDWDLIMVAEDDLERTAESLRSCGVHVRALSSRLDSVAAVSYLWRQVQDVHRMPDVVVLINRALGRTVLRPGGSAGLMRTVEAELAPTVQLVRLAMAQMSVRGTGEIILITEPQDGPQTDDAVERACATVLASVVEGWRRELSGTRIAVRTHAVSDTSAITARSSLVGLFDEADEAGMLPRFRALTRDARNRLRSS